MVPRFSACVVVAAVLLLQSLLAEPKCITERLDDYKFRAQSGFLGGATARINGVIACSPPLCNVGVTTDLVVGNTGAFLW